jgi:hypothetical protein
MHTTLSSVDNLPLLADELDWLSQYVRLSNVHLIELGCGAARTAKQLLAQHPDTHVPCKWRKTLPIHIHDCT